MSLHKEIEFENDICNHLANNGWLYAEGDAQFYDRGRALFPTDIIAWLQETQPKAWEAIQNSHGASAEATLLDRLRKQLNDRGTLDVLRNGIEMVGLRHPLQLAQFRPALSMNEELLARYHANRLRVVRQVHYSTNNENSIDLVLLLNGIPVATSELKSDFTQSVEDAIDQYRFDRDPRPKGKSPETLLDFPRGASVHFAVSNSEVWMTTKLQGAATSFIPFNKGTEDGGAGNPINPNGHQTAYLWEEVWQRDSWLEILGKYLITKKNKKKYITSVIFPRYHQLDATRKLVAEIRHEGANGEYLIQHSAGSGKTNTIAWTAHFLADLHDDENNKVFDTILVVSDRNVLDAQLQEAIFDFERTHGVVVSIKGESKSKSNELAEALSGGKKIVVCTIQTFPFALKTVHDLAATKGKTFAVIADEAHSSQTKESRAKLKEVLSAEELAAVDDGGEIGTDVVLAANMKARASRKGVTYIAFTATPKAKTLELFGRRPHPELPAGPDNLPEPFHVYTMRQAIEEGFILDVLKNYISYKWAFKLANGGSEIDDQMVESSKALKGIMKWVKLHPFNISQKVQIVVEHFRENVEPLLSGNAKAMVVVASRMEAVRWKIAIDKYIQENKYNLGTLVAFSNEVIDPESGPEPFSEHSKTLNPRLNGRDIRNAFATEEYRVLLVANKYQTGFDEPLLCGMYVDKRLAGVQAVQTLSRLNRAYHGEFGKKDTTYILDFVNEPDDILAEFKKYYETAQLSGVTEPDLILNLRAKLDAAGYYDDYEVERVVQAELKGGSQKELSAAITPVADRLLKQYKAAQQNLRKAQEKNDSGWQQESKEELEALTLFKKHLNGFVNVYSFLSQIFDYGNTDIEKRYILFKRLLPLLEFGRERDGVDLSKLELTHYNLKNKGKRNLPLAEGDGGKLNPISGVGTGEVRDKEKVRLAEIVEKLNALFEGDVTEDDKVSYANVIKVKLLESETLAEQAMNNTKEQFANSPDLAGELLHAIMEAFAAHTTMSKQALDSVKVRNGLLDILLGPANLYESLRTAGK